MRRYVALMNQLYEAKKYLDIGDIYSKRLAVILLDNFVEVQLLSLLKNKFMFDNEMKYQYARIQLEFNKTTYSIKKQNNIIKHYDEAIKTAAKENYISSQTKEQLLFCHNVRNAVYHEYEEEDILVTTAAFILYEIIKEYQGSWRNASSFTSYYSGEIEDVPKRAAELGLSYGLFEWDNDWEKFKNTKFVVISFKNFSVGHALSGYLERLLDEAIESIGFIKEFTGQEYNYNLFFMQASFSTKFQVQKQELYEQEDLSLREKENAEKGIYSDYCSKWKPQKESRIKSISRQISELAKLSSYDALKKYHTLYDEITLIRDSFVYMHSTIEEHIQLQIDIARGK